MNAGRKFESDLPWSNMWNVDPNHITTTFQVDSQGNATREHPFPSSETDFLGHYSRAHRHHNHSSEELCRKRNRYHPHVPFPRDLYHYNFSKHKQSPGIVSNSPQVNVYEINEFPELADRFNNSLVISTPPKKHASRKTDIIPSQYPMMDISPSFTVIEQQRATPFTAHHRTNNHHGRHQIKQIVGDGDCFFTAIADELMRLFQSNRTFLSMFANMIDSRQIQDRTMLASRLRWLCVYEWLYNRYTYESFLDKDIDLKHEADRFLSKGFFESPLGDCAPLAVANIFAIRLEIHSSRKNMPIVSVTPTVDHSTLHGTAYLYYTPEGSGHYDVFIPSYQDHNNNNNNHNSQSILIPTQSLL